MISMGTERSKNDLSVPNAPPQCPGKIQANNPVETYKFNHVNKKGIGICR
jgi:hypothetical protein